MRRFVRGALIFVCILLGLLVMSNLDKGLQRFAPDELQLVMGYQQSLHIAVAKVPGASIVDEKTEVVVPLVCDSQQTGSTFYRVAGGEGGS